MAAAGLEGLAFLLGGKGHVGARSQDVRKVKLMGLREADGISDSRGCSRWEVVMKSLLISLG